MSKEVEPEGVEPSSKQGTFKPSTSLVYFGLSGTTEQQTALSYLISNLFQK